MFSTGYWPTVVLSAPKRIKTYARNTTGQTRLSALSSMAIEKD